MDKPLKIAIVQSGKRAYEIERSANLPYTKLSRIVNGVVSPSMEERKRISKVLNIEEEQLFPKAQENKGI